MLVLRKAVPKTIEDLTIFELTLILFQIETGNAVIHCSEEYLSRINQIEADNYENINLGDKQIIRHCQRMLSVAIGYGVINESFRCNFIKRLQNRRVLEKRVRFVQLSFDKLIACIYGLCPNHKSVSIIGNGLYKVLYHNSPDRIYQQHGKHWISEGYAASDDVETVLNDYQKSISVLRMIFYIMTINRFYFPQDIRQYLKGFFELPRNIIIIS